MAVVLASHLPAAAFAQGVATAFWALAELSSRCPPQDLNIAAEAPALLARLAQTAAAHAGAMQLEVLADVLRACAEMRPEPCRDELLLRAATAAACRRMCGGAEQPTPRVAGQLALALGRLAFLPRSCHCAQRSPQAHLLDGLGAALVEQQHVSRPQAGGPLAAVGIGPVQPGCRRGGGVCWLAALLPTRCPLVSPAHAPTQDITSYLWGASLLGYMPPDHVQDALLLHLGAASPAEAGSQASAGNSADREADEAGMADSGSDGPRLLLASLSCQELTDLVGGAAGQILVALAGQCGA